MFQFDLFLHEIHVRAWPFKCLNQVYGAIATTSQLPNLLKIRHTIAIVTVLHIHLVKLPLNIDFIHFKKSN